MSKREERRKAAKQQFESKKFWNVRSIFGYNDTWFYLFIGGRDVGKSYSVMDRFIREYKRHGIPFYWIRLTDKLVDAML